MDLLSSRFLILTAVLVACSGNADARDPVPRRITATDLGQIVLRADEAPVGTVYLAELSGPVTLEQLWSPDCCPGQIAAFDEAGFTTGYRSLFEKPGHSGDPVDARPGVEVAASTVALFTDAEGASEAMRDWYDYYRSPVFDPVPSDGLGVEAIAVMGSPNSPAEAVYLYLWRIDRLLLSLRVSAGRESIDLEQVRAMVDRMDARAS